MKKIISGVLITLLMMLVLTACGENNGNTNTSNNSKNNKKNTAEGNKKEDNNESNNSKEDNEEEIEVAKEVEELITCESFDLGSLDVASYQSGGAFLNHASYVYETLVYYDNGEIRPLLAESWEVNENEYTFHLRKDVEFTDGSKFNAEVVKLNYDMLKTHRIDFISWLGAISKLQSIEVVDEYTVKFIYDKPYFAALEELTMAMPFGIMSPKMFENGNVPYDNAQNPCGTGKYTVGDSEQNKYYSFDRNYAYWGEKPIVKKYTVKIIPDADSKIMALKSGEIDFIVGEDKISHDAFTQLKSDDEFEAILSEERLRTRGILLNTSRGPLTDVNVRKAVQYGVNKDEIVGSILYGLEDRADYLLNPELPYCNVEVDVYEYNKSKAEELLDGSGWIKVDGKEIREKDGQPLVLEIIYRQGHGSDESLAQGLKGQLKDIGIDVKLSPYEIMSWYGMGMQGSFDLSVHDTYGIPYDPQSFIAPMTNASFDVIAQQGLSNKKEIDEKINRLFETVDGNEIQEIFDYILTTLNDEAVNLPVSYVKQAAVYNKSKIDEFNFKGDLRGVDLDKSKFK